MGFPVNRVSHETWRLVNGLEYPLPYTVLDSKGFMQFISSKKSFAQIYFTLKVILRQHGSYYLIIYLLLSVVLNNYTNYGRIHSKIFTNRHVLWHTLYLSLLRTTVNLDRIIEIMSERK